MTIKTLLAAARREENKDESKAHIDEHNRAFHKKAEAHHAHQNRLLIEDIKLKRSALKRGDRRDADFHKEIEGLLREATNHRSYAEHHHEEAEKYRA